jgi:branched-chain amino acid transport system permease protein
LDVFLVTLLNGVVYGLLLFMVSAGLTLVFGMMGVLNFAHASFYMLGAYAGFAVSRYVGFWPGIVVGAVTAALVGVLVERGLLQRVRRFGHTQELLLTFGVAFVIEEVIKTLFGPYPVAYSIPQALRFTAFSVGQSQVPFFRLLIGLTALSMFTLIFALLRFSRVGMVVRAAVLRPQMVSMLGHNVPAVFTALFALGAAMAGIAGAVGGAFYSTSPNMAAELGVLVFVVVVVGGLGSLGGALASSLLIGLAVSFVVSIDASLGDLLRRSGWTIAKSSSGLLEVPLSATAGMLPYALMLLVLLVRPSGLAGDRS